MKEINIMYFSKKDNVFTKEEKMEEEFKNQVFIKEVLLKNIKRYAYYLALENQLDLINSIINSYDGSSINILCNGSKIKMHFTDKLQAYKIMEFLIDQRMFIERKLENERSNTKTSSHR